MKILYAYDYKFNKWYIIDMKTGVKDCLTRRQLTESHKDEKIYNIKVYGDIIEGKGYSLARISNSVSNGRVYVYAQIIKNGRILSYHAVDAMGNLISFNSFDTFLSSKVSNIDLKSIKNGEPVLLDNTFNVKKIEVTTLKYQYDAEDYIKLFKEYSKFGFSRDKHTMAEYSKVFNTGFTLDAVRVESNMESFIRNHKIVISLINSGAHILYAYPVYEKISIKYAEQKIQYSLQKIVGYILEFTMIVDKCKYNRKLLISNKDKKLMSLIKKEHIKLSSSFLKIISTYSKQDLDSAVKANIDGRETEKDKLLADELLNVYHGLLDKAKETGEVSLEIRNGAYWTENRECLKFRNDIKINSIENKMLLGLILK